MNKGAVLVGIEILYVVHVGAHMRCVLGLAGFVTRKSLLTGRIKCTECAIIVSFGGRVGCNDVTLNNLYVVQAIVCTIL